MRRFLAILCTLFILCSSLNLAVFAADGVTENAQGNTVVLEQNTADLVIDSGATLDLNGYSVNNIHVRGDENAVVYCTDSATDDYTVADGVYGKITGAVEGTVLPSDGYMQIAEESGISFHRVNLEIYAMTLRPDVAGVYYTSRFAGDEVVAAQVESYGVALSVKGEPTPGDKNCGYSIFNEFKAGEGANEAASGTLLKNILKTTNTNAANTRNANMEVYGRAYLKTADGYVFGGTVSRSLKEQVEAIDEAWASLQAKQKAAAVAMYKTYTSVMADWNIPNMVSYSGTEIQPGLDGEITLPIAVTAEDGVVTEEVTISVEGISVTVPAGVKLAEGAEGLTLKITPLETSEAGIDLTSGQIIMPVDVHVDGVSAENTVPLTIGLGKVMAENLNMGNYAVYHVENGKAGKMVLISSTKPFTAHNQYKYTLDGELTLHMATFSEVAVVSDTNNFWQGDINYEWYDASATELYIRTADQLAGFNKIVSGDAGEIAKDGFAGKTVTLLSDIAFEAYNESMEIDHAKIWYPVGYWKPGTGNNGASTEETWYEYGGAFQGTFNGNGHIVSNIYQRTWDMDGNYDKGYWKAAMGLFGYVYGGTVKNLTINNFYSVGEFASTGCVATCAASTATFENISVINSHPQAYNVPVAGVVGYAASDDGKQSTLNFKNITVDNSNTISALWGTYDACCAGILATTRANTIVNLENCHVSAKMDVYNDVCANYQYYWYRGSGMLVGGIRNVKNGVVDISNIHTTNCTVDFGDWNNYYYCEFVKNGNPSYCDRTQDFKFSRIPKSELDDTDPENITCTHDHSDPREDNAAVLLPFYQLFAGRYDGTVYGIRNISVYDVNKYDTVNIKATAAPTNTVKFQAKVETDTVFKKGATITLGELFENYITTDYLPINDESVWANAVDTATGIDVATFTQDKTDWTKSSLTFKDSYVGQIQISIQDYQYCKPTVLTLQIGDVLERIDEMDFSEANGKKFDAYCPTCDKIVTWEPKSGTGRINYISAAGSYHYYLSGNINFSSNNSTQFLNLYTSGVNCCVYLNGKSMTQEGRMAISAGSTLNILGNGDVTFKLPANESYTNYLEAVIYNHGGTLNIYGGNYTTTAANKNIILSDSATSVNNIYAGTLTGAENGTVGNVKITNGGAFNMYGGTLQNGTSITAGGNLYATGDVYIGKDAVITGGTAYQGGNIYTTGSITLTTAGKITNGTALTKIVSNADDAAGGNIYTNLAATLNITGGEISNGVIEKNTAEGASVGTWSTYCYGPNIRTYGANVNVSGGLIYGGSSEGVNTGGWNLYTGKSSSYPNAALNISGGTIVGDVFTSGGIPVTLSGAPQIVKSLTLEGSTTVQAKKFGINLPATTIIDDLSPEANICVTANSGVINAPSDNLKNVKTCFTNFNDALGFYQQSNDVKSLMVGAGRNAYCSFCDKTVSWIQVSKTSEATRIGYLKEQGSVHYYLNNDFTAGPAQFTEIHGTQLCFDLNGKNLKIPARIYVANATASLNLIANDGSIEFTGEGSSGFIDAAFKVGSNVNVVGGTYTTSGAAETAGTPIFYVATNEVANPTLTDAKVEGELQIANGNVTLADSTSVETITVSDNGKLTVAEGWTGSAVVTFPDAALEDGVVAAANGVATGDFAGALYLATGERLVNQDGRLVVDKSFNDAYSINYCQHCDKFVEWTALTDGESIGAPAANTEHHYYVATEMTAASGNFIADNMTGATNVCLHLNGKQLTIDDYIYSGRGYSINIMGDGKMINNNGKTLFKVWSGTLNLYGGTYVANGTAILLGESSSSPKVYLNDDVKIEGLVDARLGNLYINDIVSITKLKLSGGKTTIAADWTGTLALDATAVMVDQKVPTANFVVTGGELNGTVTDTSGNKLTYVDGRLGYHFDPNVETNYCRVCKKDVAWEELPATWQAIAPKGSHHYYVPETMSVTALRGLFYADSSLTAPEGVSGPFTVCLYLNNKTLTMTKGSIYGNSGGAFNIIGDGTVQAASGSVFTCATGTINLYGGTYIASETGPVLSLNNANAKINLYEDAELRGKVTVTNCKYLDIYDEAVLSELYIAGGKTTFQSGWTGQATLTVLETLLANGLVPTANAVVEGTYNDNITSTQGVVTVENGAITITPATPAE